MIYSDEIVLADGTKFTSWNEDTKTYKLWVRRKSSRVWLDTNYLDDWCDGNESLFAKLMILVSHTDVDNIIVKRSGSHYIPISKEDELMELLRVKRSKWFEVKKFLNKKKILVYGELKLGDEIYRRYYINPLITLHSKGLSLTCYKLFREYLLQYLTERAQYLLDAHLTEHFTTVENKTC